ncbi:MAG: RimK family alpha-L-glutamate ligase [Eubacterium sp.]|nr:RimK family alpha-L-glutamate ligase [Eubacterium sp.]
MKQGWLIVNGFLQSEKFEEIYRWLIDAAAKQGMALQKLTNDQLTSILPISSGKTDWRVKPDFVLFWDKDVRLAQMLEAEGFCVLNSAAAIETCDDKALTYIRLKNTEIQMPKTFIAPMTFFKEYPDHAFLMQVENSLGYPMVIKESKGSFGEQVYLIQNHEEAVKKIQEIGHHEFIMQEYIETSKGRDIRINVVGNQVVTAMERTNENDFRANITNGGSMKSYMPTEEESALAVKVCQYLGLDFAGVDILFGKDHEPLLCEVNSNAHFKNIYDCTGVNVADAIMHYIASKSL